jgi:hypothetical protein
MPSIQSLFAIDHAQRANAFAKKSFSRANSPILVQILQVCIIRCLALLAGAKNGIGLIKQLFLPILDSILVYVKFLGKFRQRLVACTPSTPLSP